MELIVDANILVSLLLNSSIKFSIIKDMAISLIVPEYVWIEIEEHRDEFIRKTSFSDKEYLEAIFFLKSICITFYDYEYIDKISSAKKICPDPDDVVYFALALKLIIPIWSDDKKLKNQDTVKVYSTEDLLKL
jgi:predicted nucleic acid-binding protein